MKLNIKYSMLYLLVCILLFWGIIKYGSYVCIEGLTNNVPYPSNALIDYNNLNSPEYSHTVNMPILSGVSCKNFCGPDGKCILTKTQCTSDVDCFGCTPRVTNHRTSGVTGVDAAGKLTYNGLQYSSLTTGYDDHNIDFIPLHTDIKETRPYQGVNTWERSFNSGLELYNRRQNIQNKYTGDSVDFGLSPESKKHYYEPKYPMNISATGLFYETTPPAANAAI